MSGGFESYTSQQSLRVTVDRPMTDGRGWLVMAYNLGSTVISIQVHAVCVPTAP